jgi:DNA-binding response OmpR family regulator
MNSDPSGTDEGIPAADDVIDIFVLCGNSTDALQLEQQMAPMGYRVTLFTGTASLLESLRAGKPNLLICDITGAEQDACEICREIKADEDLWRIPVLLITGIESLSDLLIVLDSNADNFIARPYDPQYLLSLIDAMRSSPIEKPDPEKIKTQFKIRHDDHEYVITADRRKLLEFLLSSFEIAVSRATEQMRVQQELDALAAELEQRVADRTKDLSNEVGQLETMVKEHTRSLSLTETALQEQKKEVKNVRGQIEEREREIAANKEEIARLTQDLESTRSRLAEAEATIRTLATEKDELDRALRGDAEALNRDLGQSRADLESIRRQLQEEIEHRTSLDIRCGDITRDNEQAKKAISARAIELEQLKSALAAEKERAATAEQEVKTVLQEKSRTEQDLQQMLQDVTEKVKQQVQENLRLADDLASEQSRRTEVEHQIEVFRQETTKKEIALVAERGSIREHRDALQQKFDALTESFGAERQKSTSLESEVQSLKTSLEQRDGEMRTFTRRLEEANAATEEEKHQRLCAEKTLKEIVSAKDEELQSLRSANDKLREDLDAQKTELAVILRERETAKSTRKDREDELAAAVLGRAQSEKLVQAISVERDQLRDELGNEQRLRRSAEEGMSRVMQAKENVEQNLHALTEEKATEESSRQTRIQKDKEELGTMLARQKSLESMLIAAEKEQAEKEAALQALSGELEQLMAQLEAETGKRREAEKELAEIRQVPIRKKPVTTTIFKDMPAEERAIIVKEADLPAVFDSDLQAVALKGDAALVRDDLSAPLHEEPEEMPPVEIRSVEDLYEEPRELDINDLPDAAPALVSGAEVQRDKGATGLAAMGSGISSGAGEEEEPCTGGPLDDENGESHTGPVLINEAVYGKEPAKVAGAAPADAGTVGYGDAALATEDETGDEEPDTAVPEMTGGTPATGEMAFSRQQWFDLVKWAHNTPALSHEDRLRIVRLGRLIQKGRRLTRRQEAQLTELVTLARSMGYQSNN